MLTKHSHISGSRQLIVAKIIVFFGSQGFSLTSDFFCNLLKIFLAFNCFYAQEYILLRSEFLKVVEMRTPFKFKTASEIFALHIE